MGCDGGDFCYRSEMVKVKKPGRQAKPEEQQIYCAISKEPLRDPIVITPTGQLLNKESLLVSLLNKKYLPGVRSSKDVVMARLKQGQEYFECPLTGKPLNGRHQFLFWSDCGCVYAEAAKSQLREDSREKACLVCGCRKGFEARINAQGGQAKSQLIQFKKIKSL